MSTQSIQPQCCSTLKSTARPIHRKYIYTNVAGRLWHTTKLQNQPWAHEVEENMDHCFLDTWEVRSVLSKAFREKKESEQQNSNITWNCSTWHFSTRPSADWINTQAIAYVTVKQNALVFNRTVTDQYSQICNQYVNGFIFIHQWWFGFFYAELKTKQKRKGIYHAHFQIHARIFGFYYNMFACFNIRKKTLNNPASIASVVCNVTTF